MSIATSLQKLETDITNAYSAINTKGGVIPSDKNTENLANSINSISSGITPVSNTFQQTNEITNSYLTNVIYNSDNYNVSEIENYENQQTSYRKDMANGYSLGSTKNFVIVDNYAKKNSAITNNTVYNITPSSLGGYYVTMENDSITGIGYLKPTGYLRMISLPSCRNVRDLGGWTCDGGTVKYGKVFRGSKFAGSVSITLSDADKNIFRELLGIKTEIDFQLSSEGGVREYSVLGTDIEYIPIPVNRDYTNLEPIVKAINKIFYNAMHNLPIYFHCFYGADRTGTCACILESLLGIEQSSIDKDYELTTFGGAYRARNDTVHPYKDLIAYFYTFGKNNLRDNVLKWAVRAGIELDDINNFRVAMIDGTPQPLETDTLSVTNNLTHATTDNISQTTHEYTPYIATITPDTGYTLEGATISITMGGTDITSTAYINGTINIPKVTGNLIITIIAQSSSRLPDEYQEVEYIENQTTAWIDTGITSKYGIKTIVGASITTTGSYQGVIAAYGSVRDNVGYSGLQSWWAAPNAAAAGTSITLTRDTKYDIECLRNSSGYLNYSLLSAGTNVYSDFTNTVTYGLFARNRGTTQDYPFKGKIYYCEIYDNNVQVANMIPCYRKLDNKVGMYDLARNAFYTSSNNENFIKGNNV